MVQSHACAYNNKCGNLSNHFLSTVLTDRNIITTSVTIWVRCAAAAVMDQKSMASCSLSHTSHQTWMIFVNWSPTAIEPASHSIRKILLAMNLSTYQLMITGAMFVFVSVWEIVRLMMRRGIAAGKRVNLMNETSISQSVASSPGMVCPPPQPLSTIICWLIPWCFSPGGGGGGGCVDG